VYTKHLYNDTSVNKKKKRRCIQAVHMSVVVAFKSKIQRLF